MRGDGRRRGVERAMNRDRSYPNPQAFRQALTARLRELAKDA